MKNKWNQYDVQHKNHWRLTPQLTLRLISRENAIINQINYFTGLSLSFLLQRKEENNAYSKNLDTTTCESIPEGRGDTYSQYAPAWPNQLLN